MPRKTLIRSAVCPYHVTARSNNREPFDRFLFSLDSVWNELAQQCFEISILFGVQIHAFVLMPNHIHMLISTPNEDLGLVMQHWMRSGTRSLNLHSGHSGHIFSGRYHWTIIDSPTYYSHAFKYVYRNPVRAGLCESVQDYTFSTLSGLAGSRNLPFPIHYPFRKDNHIFIPDSFDEMVSWLNHPFKIEHLKAIQKAMNRTRYQPPKAGWKRTLEELNNPLI